jgi:hypothetical protein
MSASTIGQSRLHGGLCLFLITGRGMTNLTFLLGATSHSHCPDTSRNRLLPFLIAPHRLPHNPQHRRSQHQLLSPQSGILS